MADTSSQTSDTGRQEAGTWHSVEQAAVILGLSIRTVNRHISAQKLKSRLLEGRREVFVASPEPPVPTEQPVGDPVTVSDSRLGSDGQTYSNSPDNQNESPDRVRSHVVNQPFNLETALARTDRELASSAMSVTAYQSLTRSMEAQAIGARRLAMVAWCVVATLAVGVTVAVGWTASRLTRAETDSQNLREKADNAVKHSDSQDAAMADLRARKDEELKDLRDKMRIAEQEANVAKGQVSVFEKLQLQPVSRPTSRPNLIDRLTSAFNGQ
jgi:hypothetical protein